MCWSLLVLADGTMQATEDQIEAREMKIINYNKHEYLAQHIILSMTSTCLGNKIKNLKTSHNMWDAVKVDTTTKSTLFLLNAEDQLASMKLAENDNPNLLWKVFAMQTGKGKNTITLFWAIHFTWELEPFCGAQKSST